MGFQPLHDRVLVERVEAEQKTAGGIIIPDSAQEKPQQGKILACPRRPLFTPTYDIARRTTPENTHAATN